MKTPFRRAQQNRTLHHVNLPQTSDSQHRRPFSFVVCADTQLGMTNANREWETELVYARHAVKQINALRPRPAFCCCCGDLVDMEYTFYVPKGEFTKEECDAIQDQQNRDFQTVWSELHPDIALVCLCGNHDVGNRPTRSSVDRFTDAFGDDYLAFWAHGTYNIVLNTSLFSDPTGAMDLYQKQLDWLETRLQYGHESRASNIFVFGHHPWFLYDEQEEREDLTGVIPYPIEWNMPATGGFPDYYFHIPKQYRTRVMELFAQYNVDAAFSGHFHQNLVSKASFGMDMIITSSLSMVFESTGKPPGSDEPSCVRGIRVVDVMVHDDSQRGTYTHRFEPLQEGG
jgi:serine/threonine-protein phosphatase CPPED1